MKRRFKSKISKSYNRGALYIFMFGLSFICTIGLFLGDKENTKEYLLNSLISESTKHKNIILTDANEQISSPKYMIYNSLNKIVEKNNLSVFSSIEDDNYNYEDSGSEYIEDPNPETPVDPVVYIYNTHQLEEYSSKMPHDYSVKPNVMIASYIMREKLKENGVPSVVETKNIKEYLTENKLSYSRSYLASETFARAKQEEYPSIEYLIDLHRDSATKTTTYYEQNGKSYARILLVVGLEHTKAENNIGFAEELNEIIKKDYPGLSRGVLKKAGTTTTGIYNQNLNGKSVLIEIGGVDSTIEEVNNTVEVVSASLAKLIKGEA